MDTSGLTWSNRWGVARASIRRADTSYPTSWINAARTWVVRVGTARASLHRADLSMRSVQPLGTWVRRGAWDDQGTNARASIRRADSWVYPGRHDLSSHCRLSRRWNK